MNFSYDFTNNIIVITGAATGIGNGIARGFALKGATVVIGDVNEAEGIKAVDSIEKSGGQAVFVKTDVTDPVSGKRLIDWTLEKYGTIHTLVNGAGISGKLSGMPLTGTSIMDFKDTFAVNVLGIYNTSNAIYEYFLNKRDGRIINLASVAGHSTNPPLIHYSVSKAAAISFTKNLAAEMGPYGITVNALCPGYVYTPMYENAAEEFRKRWPNIYGKMTGEEIVVALSEKNCAMKRPQTIEDLANAAMFLASDAAKNITAQVLDVAGGFKL